MSALPAFLLAIVAGYVIGSVPVGYLTGKYVAGIDVRSLGSGKIGATNVRRALGWKGFFMVLALDAVKGAAAVALADWLVSGPSPWAKALGGLAAVVGHSWSCFLGMRGGRGVATGAGAMLLMLPQVMLVTTLVGIPSVALSKYMSLGSVAGAVTVPTVTLLMVLFTDAPWAYFVFAVLASSLIIIKHKDNIERILTGTERRI